MHVPGTKGERVDLLKYIKTMREFYEREGYYPSFGETRGREQRNPEDPDAEQHTSRQRLVPRSRRRPWK